MPTPNLNPMPSTESALPRAFVGAAGAYAQIRAWGVAKGWSDQPFDFILAQWLAARPAARSGIH